MNAPGFARSLLALALMVLASVAHARSRASDASPPVPWREALAGISDTVVFVAAGGELIRAPFHLASAETLWAPAGEERLARLVVSPDGARVAWLSRSSDRDLTSLWLYEPGGVRCVARYTSLVPSDYRIVRYEPGWPTTSDPVIGGARLLEPSPTSRRGSVNVLAWREDGALLFGLDVGVAMLPPDSLHPHLVSPALVTSLRPLDPAPVYLADLLRTGTSREIVRPSNPFNRDVHGQAGGGLFTTGSGSQQVSEGRPTDAAGASGDTWVVGSAHEGAHLLYPASPVLRVFKAEPLGGDDPWAAGPATVWWAEKERLYSVGATDPTARLEARGDEPIVWLAYDPARHGVLRAAGERVTLRSEADGTERTVVVLPHAAEAALEAPGDPLLGFVSGDSLVMWDPGPDVREAVRLEGARPRHIVRLADGGVYLLSDRGGVRVHRVDAARGRLEAVEDPPDRVTRVTPTPDRGRLLGYDPAWRAPEVLDLYDPASGRWTRVANPGVIAWEPLAPRR